jgi:hypothetical protein
VCGRQYLTARQVEEDYIAGLGDSVDLVVIGGRRDPTAAGALGVGKCLWTTFYLACVGKSTERVEKVEPVFHIVSAVSLPAISVQDLRFFYQHGAQRQVPFTDNDFGMDMQTELTDEPRPTTLFTRPAVVEVVGAGFDRLTNSRFETLRFLGKRDLAYRPMLTIQTSRCHRYPATKTHKQLRLIIRLRLLIQVTGSVTVRPATMPNAKISEPLLTYILILIARGIEETLP